MPFGRYYDGVPEFVFDHYDGGVPDVKGGLQTLFCFSSGVAFHPDVGTLTASVPLQCSSG